MKKRPRNQKKKIKIEKTNKYWKKNIGKAICISLSCEIMAGVVNLFIVIRQAEADTRIGMIPQTSHSIGGGIAMLSSSFPSIVVVGICSPLKTSWYLWGLPSMARGSSLKFFSLLFFHKWCVLCFFPVLMSRRDWGAYVGGSRIALSQFFFCLIEIHASRVSSSRWYLLYNIFFNHLCLK